MNLPPELRAGLTSTDRWLIGLGLVTVCGLAWAVLAWQASAMMDMSAMGQSMQSTGMLESCRHRRDLSHVGSNDGGDDGAGNQPYDYSFRHYKSTPALGR